MSVLGHAITNFRELYSLFGKHKKLKTRTADRFKQLEARLTRLEQAPDLLLDAGLFNTTHLVPMIATSLVWNSVSVAPPETPWLAKRMVFDRLLGGQKGWRKDDGYEALPPEEPGGPLPAEDPEDPDDYVVMPAPWASGIFPGCRMLSFLSHRTSGWVSPVILPTSDTYLPVVGEFSGFAGRITGAPTLGVDGGTETWMYYPWEQTWSLYGPDRYYNGFDFNGYIFPRALLLSSLAHDDSLNQLTDRNILPVGTPIWIRKPPFILNQSGDAASAGFVFEVAMDALAGCEEE